jgi:hypothetical protein
VGWHAQNALDQSLGSLVIPASMFIFTPTSASWLNQVERWFAALAEKYLRRGTHRSTRQLEDAIRHYLDIHNANPHPFVWSKSADEILASLERFCVRVRKAGAGARHEISIPM